MSIRQTIAIVVLAGSCLAVASLSQAAEPLQTRDQVQLPDQTHDQQQTRDRLQTQDPAADKLQTRDRTQLHDSSAAGTKDRTQKRDRIHK